MKQTILIAAFFAVSFNPLQADESRQHDAHEHGAAQLGIVQEGNLIQIELDTPAFNILGFEHAPSNANEQLVLTNAVTQLKDGAKLFRFSAKAQCRFDSVDIHSGLLDESNQEDHDHAHEEGNTHADIEATWTFNCESPSRLTAIEFPLFSFFELLTDLDVDYIVDAGQGSVELSPSSTVISF